MAQALSSYTFDNDQQKHLEFTDTDSVVQQGLQVVQAEFLDAKPFSWDIFKGFDSMRVLTYSSSIPMMMKMLDEFSFESFECIFGYEKILGKMAVLIAFQTSVINDISQHLEDEHMRPILEAIKSKQVKLYVAKKEINHSKIYLLNSSDMKRFRVITGSANLSLSAFGGKQRETIQFYDNDTKAWDHYSQLYKAFKQSSSDQIDVPLGSDHARIEFTDTPIMKTSEITELQNPKTDKIMLPNSAIKIEELAKPIDKIVTPLVVIENNKSQLKPNAKAEIKKLKWRKAGEEDQETRPSSLHIDRSSRNVFLSSAPFSLDFDKTYKKQSALAIIEYFNNYTNGFVGDVNRLQRDYFTLMSYIYISPFICEIRNKAIVNGEDVLRYPSFAIIYGKSNCGKTSLVDTVITSMFGYPSKFQKDDFKRTHLRGIQENYGRYPVFFDDISRKRLMEHGTEIIKDESILQVTEYPCFILSMNAEPQSFNDETMKRCLMIYANTSLPTHKSALSEELHTSVKRIRERLTPDFWKSYVCSIMDQIDKEEMPKDILLLSSQTINQLLAEAVGGKLPDWCEPVRWEQHADRKYERPATRLGNLLSKEHYKKTASDGDSGWTLNGDKIILWDKADAFGRTSIKKDIPNFLYDDASSVGDTFVLYKKQTEELLKRQISAPGFPFRWRL